VSVPFIPCTAESELPHARRCTGHFPKPPAMFTIHISQWFISLVNKWHWSKSRRQLAQLAADCLKSIPANAHGKIQWNFVGCNFRLVKVNKQWVDYHRRQMVQHVTELIPHLSDPDRYDIIWNFSKDWSKAELKGLQQLLQTIPAW
jgi:hypothetical protein